MLLRLSPGHGTSFSALLSNNSPSYLQSAQRCFANRVRFPNTLDEVVMLQSLQQDAFACYLLGCFWYSKRRYDEAIACWQQTLVLQPDFAPAHRLLGIYAWNKQHNAQLASQYLQQAVALEPENARFLFELDYLQKQQGDSGLSAGRYYNDQPADYLFW